MRPPGRPETPPEVRLCSRHTASYGCGQRRRWLMAVRIQIQQAMLTIVLLGGAVTLVAEQPCPPQFQNIRTTERDVRLAVASCFERSITCRGLIETIAASATFVYVKTGWGRGTCVRAR